MANCINCKAKEMKKRHYTIIILALVVSGCRCVVAGESEDKARIWEKYATHAYSNLNASLNGELTPVFRFLGDFGELHKYFDQDRNPKKYAAYRQFLVQVLSDAMRGDVDEAMFANVLLELTPTHMLLPIIASEIGPQGRLHGILDGKGSDVAKKIERRSHVIYEGNVNFDHYVSYLKGRIHQGYSSQTNAEIIVEHMFRTEPQKAFISMLWADYGFLPYARGNCYLYCKKESQEVRKLQQMQADIRDYLFRSQYSFPVDEGTEDKVKAHLKALGQHEKPWVRLYLVCLMEKDRNLRFSGIIDPLADDPDERVRSAVTRIKKENPPYWKD